jgi:2-polyprenyl-3-methyl-5-hydroxy-6-metoxy-1,4-benzoquinol methylase
MKTYHIRPGYLHKEGAASALHEGYWNSSRIYASKFHQYQVYRYAMRAVRRLGSQSLLDIGCGPGTKLAMLHQSFPSLSIAGVDLPEAISYCRRTHDFGSWEIEDLNALHTVGGQADLIICSDVIEHVTDPDLLLSYLKKRTAPGGRIILSTPDRDMLNGVRSLAAPNPHHIREWTRSELSSYLTASGFIIDHHELQYPVRFWPNGIFWREVVRRVATGKAVKYNQLLEMHIA